MPVATVSIFEYLLAADGLVNLEYRLEKLLTFSRRSILYIHERWGVPEPYNIVVFVVLSLFAIIAFKKILSSVMGRGSFKGQDASKFKFNMPDFSELGVITTKIKDINEDLKEIRKRQGGQVGVQGGESNGIDAKIEAL